MIISRALAVAAAVGWFAVVLLAQTPTEQGAPAATTFEVASIKPNPSGDFRRGIGPGPGGRFSAINVPLRDLMTFAYGIPTAFANLQIVGGPAWIENEKFDVDARAPGGVLPPAQVGAMVRALLEDRFKLVVHRETRELPIYNLVIDRDDKRLGPRLVASTVDCDARRAAARAGGAPPPPAAPSIPGAPPPRIICGLRVNPGRFSGDAAPLAQLVSGLGPTAGASSSIAPD
jgi:uncharacterized protein (TIGR03435 family)